MVDPQPSAEKASKWERVVEIVVHTIEGDMYAHLFREGSTRRAFLKTLGLGVAGVASVR